MGCVTLSGPQERLSQNWQVLNRRAKMTPWVRLLLRALGCLRGCFSGGFHRSAECGVIAPRKLEDGKADDQEDGKFSVDDFRCLWNVYRNDQFLPEDLADMFQRVTAGPCGQLVFPDVPLSKMLPVFPDVPCVP